MAFNRDIESRKKELPVNIFYLDHNPKIAARMHHDKHVVKMILETAQLLSGCWHSLQPEDVSAKAYKPTHLNHPCSKWCRERYSNYLWLHQLGLALCEVYTNAYGRIHKTQEVIEALTFAPAKLVYCRNAGMTTPALAMPDEYKDPDPVAAYRAYYNGEKLKNATWKNREIPEWVDIHV